MGLNRAFDRPFMVMGGSVRTSGGSNLLSKGQLALVNNNITTPKGIGIVSTTAGVAKDKKVFELRTGIKEIDVNRSRNNYSESTMPFSLNEVRDLKVSAPSVTEQAFDEFILGYDGFDPATSFNFKPEDSYFSVYLQVTGGALDYRGGEKNTEIVQVNIQVPGCDPLNNCVDCDECANFDCREIVTEAIETLRRKQLTGGVLTMEDVVDITPVFSCNEDVELTPYQFYTLEVCDTGTDSAEALVAAQYDFEVRRVDRRGSTSVYEIFREQSLGAPDDYEQTVASIIKGCDTCPDGYSEVEGGYLYAFTIEDDGEDLSEIFALLPNYVAVTVIKSGNDSGIGFYTAVLSQPLTEAQKATFLSTPAVNGTITISLVGNVADICSNNTVTEVAWTAGEVCNATEHTYSIVLPDNKCGEDRLEELQIAYPDLDIVIADSTDSVLTGTLDTGTAGQTSNINVNGVDYVVTFTTDFATSAANFVAAEAAAILADSGITVTANGDDLVFTGDTDLINAITITGDVAWTDVIVAVPARRACQTKYEATVITNIVCDECDDVFLDYYKSEAPEKFGLNAWTKVTTETASAGCLCGIRFKAKPFVLAGEECLRDKIGFIETSAEILVAADYPDEIREGIGMIPKSTAPLKVLSIKADRTHLGGNLRDLENEGRSYFRDLSYNCDYLGRLLTGTTSNIEDQFVQYVQYTLQVEHSKFTQGFASKSHNSINYDIFVELGRHKDVEDLLNDIAANAGVMTVQATA